MNRLFPLAVVWSKCSAKATCSGGIDEQIWIGNWAIRVPRKNDRPSKSNQRDRRRSRSSLTSQSSPSSVMLQKTYTYRKVNKTSQKGSTSPYDETSKIQETVKGLHTFLGCNHQECVFYNQFLAYYRQSIQRLFWKFRKLSRKRNNLMACIIRNSTPQPTAS